MTSTRIFFIILVVFLLSGIGFAFYMFRGIAPVILPPPGDINEELNETGFPLSLPSGFSISIFAKDLGQPRNLLEDPQGTILVSIPQDGKIVALIDEDQNGVAERSVPLITGLNRPHGLALQCSAEGSTTCYLYVAETDALLRYDYSPQSQTALNPVQLATLPGGGGHFTRSLLLLPPPNDHILLVSIGSSCNVCNESDPRRASIQAFNLATRTMEPYAIGLRNSVFMAIHPSTSEVWATEMGRDLLGDDVPPDEVNIIQKSKHFGWPLCYGKNVLDTDFHKDDHLHIRPDCTAPFETPSLIDLPAHSAPLGLAFVPDSWPSAYRDSLLVAYHGSWNRSVPTGYKIVSFDLRTDGPQPTSEDFISGWLTGNEALGRPVDLLFTNDEALLISDDKAGVVYRVIANNANKAK